MCLHDVLTPDGFVILDIFSDKFLLNEDITLNSVKCTI